ncbi:uracil nucleotide/cysteinyl leukotriene receptor-like [Scleropages formosus]|uniref:Uracil nucleotide/cysteinyl leukotriene receptor-like n=1 Tax=Scleropages formosus TaxID=113540 RepID=A0A0P7ULL5_SCLFO|nr:uracil nucleotide/cysteinyl leukotriene receptor-like [Scleropages formosus]
MNSSSPFSSRQNVPMMLNSSGEQQVNWNIKESHLENIFFACFYVALLVIGVPANTLALWVFSQQKKNSPSKVFITNLAVADLFYVMILPMRVAYHVMDGFWPFGEILCRLVGYLFYLNMYCSLYFMACISLDRFLALVLPVQSLALRQKSVISRVISVLLWLFLGISMMPLLITHQTVKVNNSTWTVCLQLYREKPSSQALVSLAVAFSVPSVVMVTSYTLILHKLRSLRQSERSPMVRKAIRTVTLTLLIYIVAFVPYHMNRFIYIASFAHQNITAGEAASLWLTNRIASSLTCVSGVLDPVLYFFLISNYRKSVVRLFCRTQERDRQSTT